MKIDKEKLRELANKSDAELWGTINEIAAKHGYVLPKNTPSKAEMDKIRSIMGSPDKFNMRDAMRLMQEYKRRG
ncbi:MAG: hypothetical protein IJW38_04860 [Clostridia bacterium]|nr:hypothetical protein [Clostridia bacterium]